MSFSELINQAQDSNAIYLHIVSGTKPRIKTPQGISTLGSAVFMPSDVYKLVDECLQPEMKKRLLEGEEVLFCYNHDGDIELRVHIYKQRGTLAISAKLIDAEIMGFKQLGIEDNLYESMMSQKMGLFLTSSERDSGRSTLALSYMQEIARHRSVHIVSLEEVIERRFDENLKGLVSRCQLGVDAIDPQRSIAGFCKTDIQVCNLDSLDDPNDFLTALELASRGILVIGNLIAKDTEALLQKILNLKSVGGDYRNQLADVLGNIVHQKRLSGNDGQDIFVQEHFLNQVATRKHIRENKLQPILAFMRTIGKRGCKSYQQSYDKLVSDGLLSRDKVPSKYKINND
ncbi:MAG: hypothetical protein VX619_00725 [bacterium]|nr:hypothetical protein [bacterium]